MDVDFNVWYASPNGQRRRVLIISVLPIETPTGTMAARIIYALVFVHANVLQSSTYQLLSLRGVWTNMQSHAFIMLLFCAYVRICVCCILSLRAPHPSPSGQDDGVRTVQRPQSFSSIVCYKMCIILSRYLCVVITELFSWVVEKDLAYLADFFCFLYSS